VSKFNTNFEPNCRKRKRAVLSDSGSDAEPKKRPEKDGSSSEEENEGENSQSCCLFEVNVNFSPATAAALFGDADDISSDEEAANKVAEKVQGSDDEAPEREERRSPTGSERDEDAEKALEPVRLDFFNNIGHLFIN
jgi:hypothetical protein